MRGLAVFNPSRCDPVATGTTHATTLGWDSSSKKYDMLVLTACVSLVLLLLGGWLICDGPIRSAMRRIGEMWPGDKRAIFIEHRATSICIDALNRLQSSFPVPRDGCEVAIGGAPENDPYLLPSLMATTVLSELGFHSVNLGPNTPLNVLTESAFELHARLVWIAFTAPLPKAALERDLRKAIEHLGRREVPVALGGQATHRYRIPKAGHLHTFTSMTEMAGFARALLQLSPKP